MLKLEFSDGTSREIDLSGELEAVIFEALKVAGLFVQVFVDGIGVAWPNGANLSPQHL